jgi:hypothetical protein
VTGARSRRKGHRFETEIAAFLRGRGFPKQTTTRNTLGHGGTRQPGDVYVADAVAPLAIECKNVASSQWPSWLAQAAEQAGDAVPVVVRKTAGSMDIAAFATVLPFDDYMHRLHGLDPLVTVVRTRCDADQLVPQFGRVKWIDARGDSWAVVRFGELVRAARP